MWNWIPGVLKGITYRNLLGLPYSERIRLFCPPPVNVNYGHINQFINNQVTTLVAADPVGKFVNTSLEYVPGRWGNADVGRIYGIADIQIEYTAGYSGLGPGWLATFQIHHVVREQHLDVRAAFQRAGIARWHVHSVVPGDYPYYYTGTLMPTQGELLNRWYLWKPCIGGNDTVRGTYEPIPTEYDTNPRDRVYESISWPCNLSFRGQGDATLTRMIVS